MKKVIKMTRLMYMNSKSGLQSNKSFVELQIPEKKTHKSKDESKVK